MTSIAPESQKRKRALPRQWGCLRLLLIPIVLAVACYGGMRVFARYGGEWAMSDQIPVPPGSELIDISYTHDFHTIKTSLYFNAWTPEMLRDWFLKEGIMMPTTNEPEGYSWDDLAYTVSRFELETMRSNLYYSAILSVYPNIKKLKDDVGCGGWRVFKDRKGFLREYRDFVLPDQMSAFYIYSCWRNIP